MLDKQIKVICADTGDFYSSREKHLHWLNHQLKIEKRNLKDGVTLYRSDGSKRKIIGLQEIKDKLIESGLSAEDIKSIERNEFSCDGLGKDIIDLCKLYQLRKKLVLEKNKKIKESKKQLQSLLQRKVKANIDSDGRDHIRTLNHNNDMPESNIISVFDSSFTRMIHAQENELCEDFMVIQVYYFDIIKDLIYYGFKYKGEKYIYFTSSAGQIRTKKCVFVKESIWKQYEKTIMCGLTIDSINKKGGNNPNKHLAYMALSNSATDAWEDFNIDKTIVIDDFETNVFGTYDLVDDIDYSIKRVSDYVPITHTDGSGMMLPCMGKNRMVRAPWIKGLLGAFDYIKFIQVNNCSPIIKDIYGQEHDVIKEDIQIIFTKSQFKMWKYYDSWEQYKEFYKKYHCTTGYTNIERNKIKNTSINYQMLQTLTDITDNEILKIIKPSVDSLVKICDSIKNMQVALGINEYNENETALQKAIRLYPDLMNDEYIKSTLREIKDSMVKKYKCGKLKVNGKYTFVLPDFYAACQHWFMGIEQPEGLLKDGEVFCWLFRKSEKLDCLRSPHLYREHAVRKNIAYYKDEKRQKQLREWFTTDAIYTSSFDLISKILQFDCDGDSLLVVADKTLIEVAERNMQGIVPLYYNMKKADAVLLDNEAVYNGLITAFGYSNIGAYSNNISKIWNSDVFISGTGEEKQEAINLIKLLCMENNFCIDAAKTLYMPERPKEIGKKITEYTKCNLPAFFKYAKDKTDEQIADANESLVNQLSKLIPNPRINTRRVGLGKIDYRLLMHNPEIECKVVFDAKGKIVKSETNPVIVKYRELCGSLYYQSALTSIAAQKEYLISKLDGEKFLEFAYSDVIRKIKTELLQFGYTEPEIADLLVKFLYDIKNNKHKNTLWLCYGDYLVKNLKANLPEVKKHNQEILKTVSLNDGNVDNHVHKTKTIQCVSCGEWFEVSNRCRNSRACRCPECELVFKKETAQMGVHKYRRKYAI